MDAAFDFAELGTKLKFEDLPPATVTKVKQDIFDTMGTTLAGTGAEGTRELIDLIQDLGGKPESSIVGSGVKTQAPYAALANGFMGRSADYDDTHDTAVLHVGSTVCSAAWALAERKGGVNGRGFITAVTLGTEMVSRMGLARREGRWSGWISTLIYGYFGATLAASRILGLSQEQTLNAFGATLGQAAGTSQSLREGALTKNLDVGGAARAGVFSALAAKAGITGPKNSLEGDNGLFKVYNRGSYDREVLLDGLGKRFAVETLSFKPYPCCRMNHPYIDAALALRKEHNIKPEDIIEVIGYTDVEPHLEFHPVEKKQVVHGITEAQFSIPYTVAVALMRGAVVLDDFTEEAIKDPAVAALTKKVFPKLDTSLHRENDFPATAMDIKTKSGTFSRRIEYPYGHPTNPMTMESLTAKFRDCAAHARKPLPEAKVSQVIDTLANLEKVKDVAEVLRIVA
ncbi:MAG: MmgE/PrpD family protein [Chloroflexi bacterium]|nr:MmgE/PrpD family protein [Chloroflexota bacterium]